MDLTKSNAELKSAQDSVANITEDKQKLQGDYNILSKYTGLHLNLIKLSHFCVLMLELLYVTDI